MSTQQTIVAVSPEQLWEVLADGWLYPLFVVGASRMRDVDPGWPAVGSRLHHSVGVWPALIDDRTEVLAAEPPHRLVLRAHGWPAGAADVEFRLRASGSGTELAITEDVVSGPGRLFPKALRDPQIAVRNRETLQRLRLVAEGRTALSSRSRVDSAERAR